MMIYSGQAAIDYLAEVCTEEDPAASSHWTKFHSNFKFNGDSFSGLGGFGGSAKPYTGLRLLIHRILQYRFRYFAANYAISNSLDNLALKISISQNRAYDLDMLRQVLTLSLLKHTIPDAINEKTTACVIGDGFASMTSLLLGSGLCGNVILINLTKTLLVDIYYLKLWMGADNFEAKVQIVTDEIALTGLLNDIAQNNSVGNVIAIQAAKHRLMRECPVDLAMNIASMQEMDPPVIEAYFDDLRNIASRKKLMFYCCNRERKELPDGTITRFSDYPWDPNDRIIFDELCPWHQFYYSIKPPFYHPYDGPIRHRLVELA